MQDTVAFNRYLKSQRQGAESFVTVINQEERHQSTPLSFFLLSRKGMEETCAPVLAAVLPGCPSACILSYISSAVIPGQKKWNQRNCKIKHVRARAPCVRARGRMPLKVMNCKTLITKF